MYLPTVKPIDVTILISADSPRLLIHEILKLPKITNRMQFIPNSDEHLWEAKEIIQQKQ